MSSLSSICLFCGSSVGSRSEYSEAADQLGAEIARRALRLVYGGGGIGLMGVTADSVLKSGGSVLGVIPRSLAIREVAHPTLTELVVVETMHERKALMAEQSQAFVALPGGFGTLDELCEILTWAQLNYHAKPIGLLNVCGFFDPLLAMLDHAVVEGFLKPCHRELIIVETDPVKLLNRLTERPCISEIQTHKWD